MQTVAAAVVVGAEEGMAMGGVPLAAKAVVTLGLVAVMSPVLGIPPKGGAATPPADAWPEFHGSPALTGTSVDPTITSTNASQLGVKWMSPVGGSSSSPVVAWNSDLGATVVYDGAGARYLDALNAANGSLLWSDSFGAQVISSPLEEGNSVWIAPESGRRIFKLNASTGAVECTAKVNHSILSTPVIATPPGGHTTLYFAALGSGSSDGLVYAFSESNCSRIFTWNGYTRPGDMTGVWDPLSYGVDASGQPLLVFGSANPDSSVYAISAVTGRQVWTFNTEDPSPTDDFDVGAGVDISAPGNDGFADGMAYVECKNGIFYALNLTTGALVWSYNFAAGAGDLGPSGTNAVSTPALSGTTLVFGDAEGIYALNAVSGKLLWHEAETTDVMSSPAIFGPVGLQVVAFGASGGNVRVLALSSGNVLYSYPTTGTISSSPAVVSGELLINSYDGFLYSFALGGGNGPSPTTKITSPARGAVVNPDGDLTITGTATAPHGVSVVTVEVERDPPRGPWQSLGNYTQGLAMNDAVLADPGAVSTSWSLQLPVSSLRTSYRVLASAVDADAIADTTPDGTAVIRFNGHSVVALRSG